MRSSLWNESNYTKCPRVKLWHTSSERDERNRRVSLITVTASNSFSGHVNIINVLGSLQYSSLMACPVSLTLIVGTYLYVGVKIDEVSDLTQLKPIHQVFQVSCAVSGLQWRFCTPSSWNLVSAYPTHTLLCFIWFVFKLHWGTVRGVVAPIQGRLAYGQREGQFVSGLTPWPVCNGQNSTTV